MNADIPFWLSIFFIAGGLALLSYSSNIFIDASASIARRFGISPFIVGMVIIGFGTSAPELCVSAMSGMAGHSNLSLGNAYGSCIFNIAGILGVAAIIRPIVAKPATTFVASPVLAVIAGVSYFLLRDNVCSRADAFALLCGFFVLLPLYCWFDQKNNSGGGVSAVPEQKDQKACTSVWCDAVKLVLGLTLLIGSSHFLVWGAVDTARALGVSELMIGLTIVAIGTSLPELASAIAAARKGEHDFVLGNIVGSNFFNTLAVVGLSSSISSAEGFSGGILTRDLPATIILSLLIALMGVNFRSPCKEGLIGRRKGLVFCLLFIAYSVWVVYGEMR